MLSNNFKKLKTQFFFNGKSSSNVGGGVAKPASSFVIHGNLCGHDVMGIPESNEIRFDLTRHNHRSMQ